MFVYENLKVYQKAFEVHSEVYHFIKTKQHDLPGYLKSQLGRSCLSIMLNIAEGSGKITNKDRRNFFSIARGSAFETASVIQFLFSENEISRSEGESAYTRLDEISKMLFSMIRNLER